jgi:tRNA-binding protein
MNIFYNQNGVGDVLFVQLTTERPKNKEVEKKKDIALIKDEETDRVVAFNVFNASKYVKVEADGQVETTEEIVGQLEEALKVNDMDFELDVDFSPKFVVGHVVEKEKHPNADKLSVCKVDVGNETLQIVCGAPNVDAGQKVVVAKVGAVMPSGMVIRDAELRGIASSGMICSAKELGIPNAPAEKGIMVLSEDAVPGETFVI